MHRSQALLILWTSVAFCADFSGASALEFTRRAVAFGPRPAGSPANRKLQDYIETQLKLRHCEISTDSFSARTPTGPVAMTNIVARFPGSSRRVLAVTGHFDTKPTPGGVFVGANDGGSSTGLLLELARALDGTSHADDIYLVWFDGEEAFAQWSRTDSLYGSRHLAEKWLRDGTASRLDALINVDMIGDQNLDILNEGNSAAALRRLVWQTARDLGYGRNFLDKETAIEDDHLPFLEAGLNAIDLIDFDYGPDNAYWHTSKDTMDKLSAHSLEVVGKVVLESLRRLQSAGK